MSDTCKSKRKQKKRKITVDKAREFEVELTKTNQGKCFHSLLSPAPPAHASSARVSCAWVCAALFFCQSLLCLFLLAPHVYVVKLCFPLFFPAIFCWPCNRVNCFRFDDEAIDCVSFYGLHFGLVWFALNLHCVSRGGQLCWCCFYGVDIGNIRFRSGEGKSFKEACLTWANKLVPACQFRQRWVTLVYLSDCPDNGQSAQWPKKG